MTFQKRITILLFTVSVAACEKKEQILTPKQIAQKADSLFQTKLPKLRQQAKDDLDRRLPIEVKPKVDSILKQNLQKQPVPVFPNDNVGADDTAVN